MPTRFFLLLVAVCICITPTYAMNYARQYPGNPSINAFSFSQVHERSMSKCDICHPSMVDIENSALLLRSDLCLDCHENIVAITPEERRQGDVHASNNHPIKFSPREFDPIRMNHNIIRNGQKFFISGPTGALPLFGETPESAVVECSTCHDPHGDSGLQKLPRIRGQQGKLCLVCHLGY